MKKKALQSLALIGAGTFAASSVISPAQVSVVAEVNSDQNSEEESSEDTSGGEVQEETSEKTTDGTEEGSEESGGNDTNNEAGEEEESGEEEGTEPVVPTLDDINVLASVSMTTTDINGKLYLKEAPTLSLATACSLEGISIEKVTLRGVSGEEIYSYGGGNVSGITLPQVTEDQTSGKTVAECLTLVFNLSDGTELSSTLDRYVSNLNMTGYTVDETAPVIETGIFFDGSSKDYEGTTYYTSNGKFTVSASDDQSGIAIDRWEVSGVDDFEVSPDGNSVSFNSDSLEELNNVVTVKAYDNVGNVSESTFNLFMFRDNVVVEAGDHSDMFVSGDTSYVNSDGFSFSVSGTEGKVSKYELLGSDGSVLSESVDGTFTCTTASDSYSIRVTDVKGDTTEYALGDIFSDLTGGIVFDTENPAISFNSFSGEKVDISGIPYYTGNGAVSFNVSDGVSGIASATVDGISADLVTLKDGILSFSTDTLSEGRHDIVINSVDNVGNFSSLSYTFVLYRESPAVTGSTHSTVYTENGVSYSSEDSIDVTLDWDDSKVTKAELYKDGVLVGNIDKQFSITEAGQYLVKIYGSINDTYDYSLNQLFSEMGSSISFDTVAPVLQKPVYDGNDVSVNGTVYYTEEGTISINAVEEGSGINRANWSAEVNFPEDVGNIMGKCSVSNDGKTLTIPTTALPEGLSNIVISVKDNVGNTISTSISVNMYRESSGLEGVSHSKVFLNENKSYTKDDIDVEFKVSDSSKVRKVELLKDGKVAKDISDGNFTISEDGNYKIRVTGLINEEKDYSLEDIFSDLTSEIYFDNDKPVVRNITFDGDMKTVDGVTYYVSDGNLSVVVEDTGSGINKDSWKISGVSSDLYTISEDGTTVTIPTNILPEGRVALSTHVSDNLGNEAQFSVSPYMHRTSPEITGTGYTGNAKLINGVVYTTNGFTATLDGVNSEKVKKVELLKDGEVISDVKEGKVVVPAESGEYSIRVTDIVEDYIDYSLDQLFEDLDSTVVVDVDAPEVVNEEFSGSDKVVEGTKYLTSNGTYTISLDDEASGLDMSTARLTGITEYNVEDNKISFDTTQLKDGETEFTVVVKDALGNTLQKKLSVFMHRTFPEITGESHTSVVNQDGISYTNKGIEVQLGGYDSYKVSKIELLNGTDVVDEVENGKFLISNSGDYTVRVTDIVENVQNYRLQDLFSDLNSDVVMDTSAPMADITINGSEVTSDWVTGEGKVKIDLSDNIGMTGAVISVNGKDFSADFNSTKKESITIDLASDVPRADNGHYRVSVTVKDIAGNSSDTLSKLVYADFDKPEFSQLRANGYYVEDVGKVFIRDTISVNGRTSDIGSGIDRVELLNDGSVVATGMPFAITDSGKYILRVYDKAGLYTDVALNEVLGTSSNDIVADNTYPEISRVSGFEPDLVVEGKDSWYSKRPELTFKATDENIKSVSIKVNGEERISELSSDGLYTVDTKGLEGRVSIDVEAVDRIGFVSKDSYSFYIDTTAPEDVVGAIDKSSVIKAGTAFFKETPSIAVGATDNGVGLDKYVLSGDKDEENTNGQFTLGTGSYFVEVKDKLGNTTGKIPVNSLVGVNSNNFVVDGEAPVINASRPSGDVNGWYSGDVNYQIRLSDNIGLDSAVVTINGQEVDSYVTEELDKTSAIVNADTSKVEADANGMYHVQVTVQDNAGNISTWEDSIYIDRTAPTVDRFVFTGNGYQEGVETNGGNRYGFFFDGSATCDIYVSDGEISSGMDKLYVEMEGTNGVVDNQVIDVSGGVARVVIPDNFKGFISAYATDKVGNVGETNAPDGVVTEDSNYHINSISMDINLPETPYTDLSGNPLYNADVNINALIGCDMSGLRNLSWGINDDTLGTVNVDSDGNLSGDSGYVTESDRNLVLKLSKVLAAQGNTNGMNIWVRATDRVGHTSEANRVISIDKDAPVISVSYDNTEADGYYNTTRTATITVQERNFDASQFTISGEYGSLSGWSNNGDTWIQTITFSEDGDYQFSLGCTDRAGNVAEGYSSEKFTIDKTAPVMTVSWNSNNPSNGNYYNTERVATVTVVEHNFDGSLFNLSGDGSLSGWSSSGDTHTATVSFNGDGEYSFSLSGSDLAGNAAEGYESGEFIIDTTTPTLTIDGVQASVSYKEDVGFTVDMEDKYIDSANTTVELVGRKNGTLRVSGSTTGTSGHYSFASMPREEMYDDVYTLTAKVADLAGNVNEETITFSVNRFGSKYTFLDASMLNTYLNAPRDVVIEETNVDKLDTSKARVSIIRDGSEVDVDPDLIDIKESGGDSDKYDYTYTISKEAFDKDGKYLVQIFSHAVEGTDYSSVSEEYAFVLDTQKPEIIISGVESGEKYRAYDKNVTIDVRDMSGVKDISAKLNGKKVNLNKKDDVYSFTVSESEDLQTVEVEVEDMAGNTSVASVENFLVTSNAWLFIVNQTWFKLGIAAGATFLAAIIALIAKNRHDSKKEEEATMKEHEELYKVTGSSSSGVSTTSSTGKDMVEDLEASSEDVTAENTTEEDTESK